MAYTDAEIQEALDAFFETIAHRQYRGMRYVPIFGRKGEDSIEWDNSAPYEALTIVIYKGFSYTSRQAVPAGIDINDKAYWALTGNYNAQIELYRQETQDALETARKALTLAEFIEGEYFNDIEPIDFESGYENEYNGGWYVMKVPRKYYDIQIASATGKYAQGYAYNLMVAHPELLAISNCALDGLLLIDGEPLRDDPSSSYGNSNSILAFREDGTYELFTGDPVTAPSLKADGFIAAFQCGLPWILDGIAQDISSQIPAYEVYEPHCLFGCNDDYWYIFQTVARCIPSLGLGRAEIQALLMEKWPELDWIDFKSGSDTQLYLSVLGRDIHPWIPNSTANGPFYAKPRRGFMCFKAKEAE